MNNQHKPGLCGKDGCTQPRHITQSGRVTTYCKDHNNAKWRDYYAKKKAEIELNELKKKIPVHKPGKCPKCESPRHITKTGVVTTFCRELNNERWRKRYSPNKESKI
ncbi:hypothetical protein [Nitrosomonas communis]|nr:hypothetical protein [Nitrosomonas communis]